MNILILLVVLAVIIESGSALGNTVVKSISAEDVVLETTYGTALFEGGAKWNFCPSGYVISGFWRNSCHGIHCIDRMKCVTPYATADLYSLTGGTECKSMDITTKFDSPGSVYCPAGYFVNGIFSWNNGQNEGYQCDGLHCWEKLSCCKFPGLTYSDSDLSHDISERFDIRNWATLDSDKWMTGLYRSGDRSNDDIRYLDRFYYRRLYDTCTVKDFALLSPLSITESLDSFADLMYKNKEFQPRYTTTMSEEATVEKISTFTYSSGTEIGTSVTFSAKADWGVAELSSELQLDVKATETFESVSSQSETITQSTPATDYYCPARSICKRQRVLFKAPDVPVGLDITFECNEIGEQSTHGTYIAKGGTGIDVIDSAQPLDCDYYTDDYYNRNDGLLPNCWTCRSDSKCSACMDGKVEMDDGQCYNDDVCTECDGTVIDNESFGVSIGKYCDNENMETDKCKSFIEHDLS